MASLKELFELTVKKELDAANLCFENKFTIPGLVLVYSMIDAMAWTSVRGENVGRKDFIEWTEKYLMPLDVPNAITAEDIYSARCGLLHTFSPESDISRQRKAIEVHYSDGDPGLELLLGYQKKQGAIIIISGQRLYGALEKGVQKYFDTCSGDDILQVRVKNKLGRMFSTKVFEAL